MKSVYIIATAVLCGMTAPAQTNAPAPRPPTVIDSESAVFDPNGHQVTYRVHVRVNDPEMKLTCDWLVADLPQAGGRVDHIVATTNVVIDGTDAKGQAMHATCARAVYDYKEQNGATNETVWLTGNAKVENVQWTITGEPIIWDRVTGSVTASNQVMTLHQNLAGAATKTNSPPARTNVPPGSIDNIDKNLHSKNQF
jgi:lipopolysaccharide transport protein LptA